MGEAEWLGCVEPAAMLAYLVGPDASQMHLPAGRRAGRLDRKLRLFACACCRQVWRLLTDARSRRAVEVAERYADGLAAEEEVAGVLGTECHFPRTFAATFAWGCVGWQAPVIAGAWAGVIGDGCANQTFLSVVRPVGRGVPGPRGPGDLSLSHPDGGGEDLLVTGGRGAALLRDVVGNPFRPVRLCGPGVIDVVSSEWDRTGVKPLLFPHRWLTPAVTGIARRAYDDRDFAGLPVLADALDEAGCREESMLRHLRGPGPHARGCWVLDTLLGKE
jgi:hypothetical protein